jgi:hypothetical protein
VVPPGYRGGPVTGVVGEGGPEAGSGLAAEAGLAGTGSAGTGLAAQAGLAAEAGSLAGEGRAGAAEGETRADTVEA